MMGFRLVVSTNACRHLLICGIVSALSLLASCKDAPPAMPPVASASTPAWLAERGRQEIALAAQSSVAHDFKFTDQR
jgi:hypothetical protein